jgi:uncharacterized membrane protein
MIAFVIGMIALRVLICAFFIMLAVRLVAVCRARRGNTAIAILEKRFVNQEISAEEFAQRRKVLENN